MPLIEVRQLSPSTRLGLWKMTETSAELLRQLPEYQDEVCARYRAEGRRMEFLSVRALLRIMTGDASLRIGHEPSGKPVLPSWFVSISHTRGYAALMLSEEEQVALDIEQRSERVRRIASRFIRPDEQAATTEDMLAIWSAKETLYKLYSEDELLFSDMRISFLESGLMGENLKRAEHVQVFHELTDDYVLTWATRSGSTQQPRTIQTI